jgi:hypothetical protein
MKNMPLVNNATVNGHARAVRVAGACIVNNCARGPCREHLSPALRLHVRPSRCAALSVRLTRQAPGAHSSMQPAALQQAPAPARKLCFILTGSNSTAAAACQPRGGATGAAASAAGRPDQPGGPGLFNLPTLQRRHPPLHSIWRLRAGGSTPAGVARGQRVARHRASQPARRRLRGLPTAQRPPQRPHPAKQQRQQGGDNRRRRRRRSCSSRIQQKSSSLQRRLPGRCETLPQRPRGSVEAAAAAAQIQRPAIISILGRRSVFIVAPRGALLRRASAALYCGGRRQLCAAVAPARACAASRSTAARCRRSRWARGPQAPAAGVNARGAVASGLRASSTQFERR